MGSLGIGLSLVFGCISVGLVAEIFYLLWWKKKAAAAAASATKTKTEEFPPLFCWKNPNFFSRSQEPKNPLEQQDLEMGPNKNSGLKGEEGVEAELMRLHNLCGPPRFLFTIKEESKEDLESEEGKGSLVLGTPFLTPLSSPTVKASLLSDSYSNHGFNPLFDSELNRLRSSPPPKFKFLKDAEDKLIRKLLLMEEAERKGGLKNEGAVQESAIKDVSFVRFSNQAAQVLPLASSPTFSPELRMQ